MHEASENMLGNALARVIEESLKPMEGVLSKQIEGIHGALAELRRGLKADIAELRGEVETIKTDIAGLRDEVKTDIAELRGEIAYARERGGLGHDGTERTRHDAGTALTGKPFPIDNRYPLPCGKVPAYFGSTGRAPHFFNALSRRS